MKVGRRVVFWITAFAVVFLTFWFGYTREPAEVNAEHKAVPVEVQKVSTDTIENTIELTGWIEANMVVDVKSKVAGRIESLQAVSSSGNLVPVEEGLTVTKGQQLAIIDHDVYLAQVSSAEAAVKAAEVELADAEREKKRILSLYQGGSATEQSKDKAVTSAELAAARLSSAKAALELAKINLNESTIISPIDGTVTKKHIDQGNLVSLGSPIVTLADMKTVKVIVSVAEKYTPEITVATPAEIRVDAFPEKVFTANVYSVYPALDQQTHTIQVEIRLSNEDPPKGPRSAGTGKAGLVPSKPSAWSPWLLKPGMFARVTLITQRKDNVVVIPRDVILGGKIDKPYVYVLEDGVAHKRIVEVGIIEGPNCEITNGLKAGETLVVNGMHSLTEGSAVELVRLEDIK